MPTITGETSHQSRLNIDEMGEEGKTLHALVWHMIIEWFCQLDHTIVGTPLLKALMDYSSFWTGAPKQARERAALRYLEEAMDNPTLPSSSAASTSSANPLSFEDLLLSYLNRKENPKEDIMALNIEVLGNIMDNKPKLPPPLLDLVLSNYNDPLDEPQPVVGSPSPVDNPSQPETQTRIGAQEPVQKQSVVQEQVQEQPVIGSLLDQSQTQPETRTQIETQKRVQKQVEVQRRVEKQSEVQKPVQEQHVIASLLDPSQTQPETRTQIETQKRVQKQSEVRKLVQEQHVIGSLLDPSQTQPQTRTQIETKKLVQKQSEVQKSVEKHVIGSLLYPSQTQPGTPTQIETREQVQKQSEVQKQVQEQPVIGSLLDPSQTQPETQTQIETQEQVQKQSEDQEQPVIESLSDPSQTQPETETQELISDRYPKRKRRTTPTVNDYQTEEKSNKKIQRAANKTGSQLGRRKIIRFTKEEEEILEKGMEKFREEGGEIWIKIREFGKGVFEESRLPMDLKDKWRNMLKNKEKKRKKEK